LESDKTDETNDLLEKLTQLEAENESLKNELQIMESIKDALWEAEAKYHDIYDYATEGIYQATLDDSFISVNPALVKIFGYDNFQEMTTGITNINQLYRLPNRHSEFLELVRESGKFSKFESQVVRKDGTEIWISESGRLIRDSNNEMLCYEGMVSDITQRKNIEAALHHSQVALETKNKEFQFDLNLATEVQQSLLSNLPDVPFLDIALKYLPHSGVSGDTYVFSINREGTLNIFFGDATGHGIAAAFVTMMVHVGMKSIPPNLATHEAMQQLNKLLFLCIPEDMFVSGIYLRITQDGKLSFCNAGHPPLLIHPVDKIHLLALKQPGTVLGMFDEELRPFTEKTYQLQPGDRVYLYTDGITEWSNPQNVFFKVERLTEFLSANRTLPLNQIPDSLITHLQHFSQGRECNDDVTFLGIEFKGA